MKKFILTILIFLGSTNIAFAQSSQASKDLGLDKFDVTKFLPIFRVSGVVDTIINLVFLALILFFIFRGIFAGIKMSGAGGDSAKVQESFKALINNIIGFVISLLALVITNFILAFFGISAPTSILPDCKKITDLNDKITCQEQAIKLIDSSHLKRDCDYIGGDSSDGKTCKPQSKGSQIIQTQ